MAQKVILFGGTFDPVHTGHIEVVQFVAEKIGTSKVILIPANRSPHKFSPPKASGQDRLRMLSLATQGKSLFEVSDCELKRPGPSYTLDTVNYFRQQYGADAQFYWLIGADMVKDLPKWYKIDELMDQCNVCVMLRAGFDRPDFDNLPETIHREQIKKLKQNIVETPLIDISSTVIRSKIASGESVADMLCPAVAEYIRQNKLYGYCRQ